LPLRINKHVKGYVEFYYGPEKLSQIVDNEAISSPSNLLIDSDNLLNNLGLQGYDIKRERYLKKFITSIRTSIELLNGIEISIEEQFLKLYDVALQPANESELKNLKKEYDEAYGGPGSLEERLDKLRVTRRVPEAKIFALFKKALIIVRRQTNKLFTNLLPEEEHISIDLVEKTNEEIK
ncbi:MAG: hypothetical protein ACTSO8_00665, partial [Promethearchaeota archaeon]